LTDISEEFTASITLVYGVRSQKRDIFILIVMIIVITVHIFIHRLLANTDVCIELAWIGFECLALLNIVMNLLVS
jgi:hypothetical protein